MSRICLLPASHLRVHMSPLMLLRAVQIILLPRSDLFREHNSTVSHLCCIRNNHNIPRRSPCDSSSQSKNYLFLLFGHLVFLYFLRFLRFDILQACRIPVVTLPFPSLTFLFVFVWYLAISFFNAYLNGFQPLLL